MTSWKLKLKILGAVGMLLLALSMIGVGTFAWFTIGQRARAGDIMAVFSADKYPFEVSYNYGEMLDAETPDEATWAKDLNVSELLLHMNENESGTPLGPAPLRPVSTADMVHWYVADYDADGNVSGFNERDLNDIANLPPRSGYSKDNPNELGDISGNHVLYFDMWVRTTNPGKTYGLKLQTARPRKEDGTPLTIEEADELLKEGKTVYYGDKLVEETVYGTYVLGKPKKKESPDTGYALPDATNGFTSLRIGFMPIADDGTGNFTINGNPLIYEPNANLHLEQAGLESRPEYEESQELIYRIHDTKLTEVQGYQSAWGSENNITYVPTPDGGGYKLVEQGSEVKYNGKYALIYAQQSASEWDEEKLSALNGTSPDSSCVKVLGQFPADPETGYPAELPTMVNITYGTPQRIRVYFWIEGQDVDCWNQILGTDIIANFEFVGTDKDDSIPTIIEPESEPEPNP